MYLSVSPFLSVGLWFPLIPGDCQNLAQYLDVLLCQMYDSILVFEVELVKNSGRFKIKNSWRFKILYKL
jgi:hypothetical protein